MNITVEAKGFAAQSRSVEVAAGKAPVEFYLARGYTVRGRVVDERGNPIQGATVGAQPPLTWHAETDRDGLFVWNSAPDRMSTLQVRAPGFRETYTAPLPAGEEEHEIRLQSLRRIRVSGRVIDAGIVIGPERVDSVLQLGLPIRIGCRLVAAVAARWPADRVPPPEAAAVSIALLMAPLSSVSPLPVAPKARTS